MLWICPFCNKKDFPELSEVRWCSRAPYSLYCLPSKFPVLPLPIQEHVVAVASSQHDTNWDKHSVFRRTSYWWNWSEVSACISGVGSLWSRWMSRSSCRRCHSSGQWSHRLHQAGKSQRQQSYKSWRTSRGKWSNYFSDMKIYAENKTQRCWNLEIPKEYCCDSAAVKGNQWGKKLNLNCSDIGVLSHWKCGDMVSLEGDADSKRHNFLGLAANCFRSFLWFLIGMLILLSSDWHDAVQPSFETGHGEALGGFDL